MASVKENVNLVVIHLAVVTITVFRDLFKNFVTMNINLVNVSNAYIL